MNERIREVWIRAAREDSDPDNWDTQEQFIEQFAQLIVQECLQYLKNEAERLYMLEDGDADMLAEKCYDNIQGLQDHFGVEE